VDLHLPPFVKLQASGYFFSPAIGRITDMLNDIERIPT
jgi:hypothetical protein